MVAKDRVLMIRAGEGSLVHKGVTASGYTIISPYIDKNLIGRVLREIWFRIPFLPQEVWYNKQIKEFDVDTIIIFDVLITKEFCIWLTKTFPNSKLNFIYGNLVGNAKHILPEEIPSRYKIWTFDGNDSSKYQINLHKPFYYDGLVTPSKSKIYDVLFVGADKGRADFLMSIKTRMDSLGLRTKFIIVKDGRFAKDKPYYSNPVSYTELLELVKQSRSILNVTFSGQIGITMRDMESLFFGVKLITTNKAIANADFFKIENILILNDDNIDDIPTFLNEPVYKFSKQFLDKYSLKNLIAQMQGVEL